jgi:hypothetical protein
MIPTRSNKTGVMAGLDPAICEKPIVDPRVKPGDNEREKEAGCGPV